MVLAWLLVILSAAVAGTAVDMVVESADTGGGTLIAFGRTLGQPGLPAGTWILCGFSALAALMLVAALMNRRARTIERRVAGEYDAKYEELSQRHAGDIARARLLEGRAKELEDTVGTLTTQRDAVFQELDTGRHQLLEVRRAANQQRRALRELAHLSDEQVVKIPELPADVKALMVDDNLDEVEVEGAPSVPLPSAPPVRTGNVQGTRR
ncbi:MAG: hypothetical protein ACM3OO_06170 [Planctomycetaceae bacterium]